MKLKTELLAITAASILACTTAFAEGAGPGLSESGTATPGAAQSVTDNESPTATGTPPLDENQQAQSESEPSESASAPPVETPSAALPEDAQPTDAEQRAEAQADASSESAQASSDPTASAAGGGTAGGTSETLGGESAQAPSEPAPSASGAGMAGGATQQLDPQTVEDIQQALNDKGFDAGPVDGIVGPKTQGALREFQQEQGMQASGEPDQETLSALGVQG